MASSEELVGGDTTTEEFDVSVQEAIDVAMDAVFTSLQALGWSAIDEEAETLATIEGTIGDLISLYWHNENGDYVPPSMEESSEEVISDEDA